MTLTEKLKTWFKTSPTVDGRTTDSRSVAKKAHLPIFLNFESSGKEIEESFVKRKALSPISSRDEGNVIELTFVSENAKDPIFFTCYFNKKKQNFESSGNEMKVRADK